MLNRELTALSRTIAVTSLFENQFSTKVYQVNFSNYKIDIQVSYNLKVFKGSFKNSKIENSLYGVMLIGGKCFRPSLGSIRFDNKAAHREIKKWLVMIIKDIVTE